LAAAVLENDPRPLTAYAAARKSDRERSWTKGAKLVNYVAHISRSQAFRRAGMKLNAIPPPPSANGFWAYGGSQSENRVAD
jgi:hypothetical protein